jgi:DNA-binding transcriptional LysR family regulator
MTRLTADGEAYLAACELALEEVTAAQIALSSSGQILSGRVHINMPIAFGKRVLLPVLMEIVKPHPGITLTLTFTDATTDLLREDVDLAIRFGALADSSRLVARQLGTQPRLICAAPGYLRERGTPQTLADVEGHRCVVGTLNGPPTVWVVSDHGIAKNFMPPATHQLSDGEAMVDAAVAGWGLVQLPAFMVREKLNAGLLIAVLSNCAGPDIEVHAVWPRRAHLSSRVRYLVDQCVAYAAQGRLGE